MEGTEDTQAALWDRGHPGILPNDLSSGLCPASKTLQGSEPLRSSVVSISTGTCIAGLTSFMHEYLMGVCEKQTDSSLTAISMHVLDLPGAGSAAAIRDLALDVICMKTT